MSRHRSNLNQNSPTSSQHRPKRYLRDPRDLNFHRISIFNPSLQKNSQTESFQTSVPMILKAKGRRHRRNLTIRRASPEDWRMACESLFAPNPFPGSNEREPHPLAGTSAAVPGLSIWSFCYRYSTFLPSWSSSFFHHLRNTFCHRFCLHLGSQNGFKNQ